MFTHFNTEIKSLQVIKKTTATCVLTGEMRRGKSVYSLYHRNKVAPSYKENYTTCVLTGEMRRGRSVFTLFNTEIKSLQVIKKTTLPVF